jgi:hypothetical protein
MNLGLLGAYWYNRLLTLRGYSVFVRDVLRLLRDAHPVFENIHWVGDGKREPVAIATDMDGMDDLVYRFSWLKKHVRGEQNPDGSPTWAAVNLIGYQMVFNTGQSSNEGGLTLSIHAGDPSTVIPNAITISFPAPVDPKFIYRDFYDYDFLLGLLASIIHLASPERGLVTSHEFSTLVFGEGPFDIGWLTYFVDDRCAPVAEHFSTERIDARGTLFTLGEKTLFVNSEETVSLGRRLRDALKQAGVLR